jgi:hypothetical protein
MFFSGSPVGQDEPFANIDAPTDMDYLDIDTLVNDAMERQKHLPQRHLVEQLQQRMDHQVTDVRLSLLSYT